MSINKTNKCAFNGCINIVHININERYREESKFMTYTTSGYRCCQGCSQTHHFCSNECLKLFEAHNRCFRCHERCINTDAGTFIEDLNLTLCNGRGDHNPSCYNKYQLEKRFIEDYNNANTQYIGKLTVDVTKKYTNVCNVPKEYDEIFKIISENENKISLDILKDINYIDNTYNVRCRVLDNESDESDNESDNEIYVKHKCIDCKKKLPSVFYYVGGDINGLTCCYIKAEQYYGSVYKYYYKESNDYFIVEISNKI